MAHRALTRGVAAGAATVFAAGALALFGGGVAGAATASVTWDDGATRFTRTSSNATPNAGDTITVTTKFERTNSTEERLNWVRDFHNTCLTYVPDSAKVNDQAVEPYLEIKPGYVVGDFMSTSYRVWVTQTQTPIFSVQYKVGENCLRGANLTAGMDYLGSRGSGNYADKGPQVTVGYLGGGDPGAGSLGSLFGS
ncbi:hypothetical protein [Rhodococcus tukisamuensis]|uniref:Uncharacterized protein n=1 Tax=Rhodococcus tukisamuensis TaxID=168276 RepID=A0A1G6W651_9NOCA|nr:hypothetical protein [Rhodococcus tukisamuensis]SDD61173.1 hypothetical protein SAMN05444580_105260 [Rhodococcus tukisamuensis]